MPKPKSIFRCSHCDSQFPKWQGRCSECGSWGTITETQAAPEIKKQARASKPAARLTTLGNVLGTKTERISTGLQEVDRVLGGGMVPGSVYIVTGDPGIGKSTLLLHVAAQTKAQLVYVSGEESLEQVQNRVDRLHISLPHTGFISETDIGSVRATIETHTPGLVIIDSLQTMHDETLDREAGSITQIKACVAQLVEVAKATKTSIFIVGHITKSGAIAGPKTLEHLVDGVLYLEGTQHGQFRILRATKNRFGSVDEVGVFEMTEKGMQEVRDASQVFLSTHTDAVPGSARAPLVEGSRIFFVEYQALVSRTSFGYPVRKSVGFDLNRLQMLVAVLQKRLRLPLHEFDVHVNVAGGMRLEEPASDAAVVAAIMSALRNSPISSNTIVFGEVGLAGEIRSVAFEQKRAHEALQLGYTKIIVPKGKKMGSKTVPVASVKELESVLFGSR